MARRHSRPLTGKAPPADQTAGRVTTLQVVTLALLAAISPLATGMYLPGLPAMASDFGTDATMVQLTVTTLLAGLAVGQLILGPLSDRWGRRRPLLVSGTVCVAASVVCVLAPTVEVLIAARFLQGFAGAAGIVLGRAIVADTVSGPLAARIFSLLMTVSAIAPVVAPLLGGALLSVADWRAVFAALTVIAIIMLVGAALALPESLPPSRRSGGRLTETWRQVVPLLADRRFVGYTLALVFSYATLIGYVSASPFVLQTGYGLSPTEYSVVFACNAGGLTVASLASARLVGRSGARRLLAIGLACQAAATGLLLTLAASRTLSLAVLLILLWISVTSLGLIAGNATSLALDGLISGIGSASAVMGAAQFAVAAAVAPLVGGADGADPVRMAVVMFTTAMLAAAGALVSRKTNRL